MAVNRNFVVKNGLQVNTSLLFVDSSTNRIGIGSTVPSTVLDVVGGIAATDLKLTGISTISGAIYGDGGVAAVQIGTGISIAGITTLAGSGGITTTGGDLYVADDVVYDEVSGRQLYISGIGTINQFQALTANVSGVTTTGILSASSAIITGIGTIQEFNVGTGGTVFYATQDGTIRLGSGTTTATVTLNGGSIPSVGLVIALGG